LDVIELYKIVIQKRIQYYMYLDIQGLVWNCHLYWAWNFVGASHQIAPTDKEMDEGMLIELKCNIVMASVYLIGT